MDMDRDDGSFDIYLVSVRTHSSTLDKNRSLDYTVLFISIVQHCLLLLMVVIFFVVKCQKTSTIITAYIQSSDGCVTLLW